MNLKSQFCLYLKTEGVYVFFFFFFDRETEGVYVIRLCFEHLIKLFIQKRLILALIVFVASVTSW